MASKRTSTQRKSHIMKLIIKGPKENILSIASFLSIRDVCSQAGTCCSVRFTLISSQGAMKCVWMRCMQEAFPGVFCRATGRSPFGMSEEEVEGGGLLVLISTSTSNKINLPLITHLLPQRYPHSIDPSFLKSELGHQLFCLREANYSIFLKDETRVILVQFKGQVGTGNHCSRGLHPRQREYHQEQ